MKRMNGEQEEIQYMSLRLEPCFPLYRHLRAFMPMLYRIPEDKSHAGKRRGKNKRSVKRTTEYIC